MASISARMIDGRFDPRSQALFRVALGLLILSQSLLLSRDFAVFYQPDSVYPSANPSGTLILHFLISGILPLLACTLIAGLLTRLATLGCYISLIVIHGANADILQGGDVLLRLLLFWSLFLPLGEVWSLDARLKWLPRLSLPWTTSLATWALTLQVCFVYWFAALLKSDPLWTQNGNALFYALSIEHFTTPFGLYLRQFPDVLRIITFGTLCLEYAGPCLLLIPYQRDRLRLIAVILFVGFHLIGMQCLLRVGLFPWVCATAWLIFIPGFAWDWLTAKEATPAGRKKQKIKRTEARHGEADEGARARPALDYSCSALVVAAFLDVLAWNIASFRGNEAMRWMTQHDVLGNALRLDQRWNMYAPYPRSDHGWLIVAGDLADGTEVDLFTGQPVSWDKPKDLGAYFGDDRWRRFLSNLFDEQDSKALQAYADYLVRRWNQRHPAGEVVQTVTIYYMKQVTQPDLTITSPEKDAIYFRSY